MEGSGIGGGGGSQLFSSKMLPVSSSLHTYTCFCTPVEHNYFVYVLRHFFHSPNFPLMQEGEKNHQGDEQFSQGYWVS